jgi:hypothetical protein
LRVAHARNSGAGQRSEPPKQRTLSGASRNARRANVKSARSFLTGLPDPVQKPKPQAFAASADISLTAGA